VPSNLASVAGGTSVAEEGSNKSRGAVNAAAGSLVAQRRNAGAAAMVTSERVSARAGDDAARRLWQVKIDLGMEIVRNQFEYKGMEPSLAISAAERERWMKVSVAKMQASRAA